MSIFLRLTAFSFLTFLLLNVNPAQAQQGLKGVITDTQTHENLPGIAVEIKSLGLGTATNSSGYYEFKNLPVGEFMLTIHGIGFDPREKSIHLNAGESEKQNVSLTETSLTLGEVKVKVRRSTESDRNARRKEKNANGLIHVVSAEAIRKSPDLNVADVLQRVSGVTLDRGSNSKDEFVIIRGLDARYNNTLINGISIPSPDDKSRSIPLDIIPADLVANLVISKTLTPDMEGDAIGGTVDVQMKDAPNEDLLDINLAGGVNQTLLKSKFYTFDKNLVRSNDPSTRNGYSYHAGSQDFPAGILKFQTRKFVPNTLEGLTFGKRFLKNKLGFLFSASNQGSYSTKTSNVLNNIENKYNQPQAYDELAGTTSYYTTHLDLNSKIDFAFNERNKISLIGIYLRTTDQQSRFSTDTLLQGAGRNGHGTGLVDSLVEARYMIQNLASLSVKGNNQLAGNLKMDYTVNYGRSNAAFPDNASMPLYNTLPSSTGYIFSPFSTSHSWQHNSDKNYQAYLNLDQKTTLFGRKFELKAGGLYRHRDRINYNNSYKLNAVDTKGGTAAYYSPDFSSSSFSVVNPQGQPEHNPANYNADEDLSSAYLMGKLALGKLKAVVGVRDEYTMQSNHNVNPNIPFNQIYHYFRYNDLLPSVNLQYALTETQDLRISYYKSISRPNYFELVDTQIPTSDGYEKGNPNLKHSTATNLDLRYDFFPNQDDALMLGVFYKKIQNPIERAVTANASSTNYTPLNGSPATNFGLELNLIRYAGNFGISGNYTFTHSTEIRRKIYYAILYKPDGSYDGIGNTNPIEKGQMQGQSAHVANLSLIYRNSRAKINASFNLLFQGRRVDAVNEYLDMNNYQLNYTVLSFSADKAIGKHLSFFVKLNNLNNAPYEIRTQNGFFVRKDRFGQDYMLGLRLRLL